MTVIPEFDRFSAVAPMRAESPVLGCDTASVFWRSKAVIDVVGALIMMPIIGLLAVCLALLNPLLNPGPLFFRQARMGQHGRVFMALKFRTMEQAPTHRGPLDPVEAERIPRLGRLLRRMGLDELPQAINILRGEMSLIGPRPDCARHARVFLETIPNTVTVLVLSPGSAAMPRSLLDTPWG